MNRNDERIMEIIRILKTPGKDYYLNIVAFPEIVAVEVIDAQTEKQVGTPLGFSSGKDFIQKIPKLFSKNVKAAILNMSQLKNHGYSSNYEFCKVVREKLNRLKISHRFIPDEESVPATILTASNFSAKIGDHVLVIMIDKDQFYRIKEFEYTQNGYEMRNFKAIKICDATRNNIVTNKKLAKIIACNMNSLPTKNLRNLLKLEKLVIVEAEEYQKAKSKFLCNTAKWMKDKSLQKFHISPTPIKGYAVVGMIGDIEYGLFTVDSNEKLPLTKTLEITKTYQNYRIVFIDKDGIQIIETKQFDKDCHKFQLIFRIDTEHFYSFTPMNVLLHGMPALPNILDRTQQSKLPVIVFWDNSSVICISKNGGEYNFSEKWNGFYGNALFINFNKKRPFLDTNITVETKMDTVVFDFLKILSMPINNIEIDEGWKFRFTKDAENPCLIEFTNFDGEKKAATPTLLMAILLRQHLKIITEEIGQKPKQIGISLIDNFNVDERKRVEEKIQESCQLLQIQCKFIKT
uniref:Uncharacterized protein n=1 Tax=Panagrolaimus sp. ES5 TaxID=591445 RepID=A0AC34F4I1_9BILA